MTPPLPHPGRGLLHHLNLNVSDVKRSSQFYGPMLRYFGYALVASDYASDYQWEDWKKIDGPSPHVISLCRAGQPRGAEPLDRSLVGRFTHLAFTAENRADVDRFYAEVLAPLERAGLCTVEDPPCECPEHGPDYYATFFFDPDGIKLEFVVFEVRGSVAP